MQNKPYILEGGEQFDITTEQAEALVKAGLIYDSGESYYHICDGFSYTDVEIFLKGLPLE